MGRSRRGDKERSKEQILKYENQKLRRQISSLRKQLARVDLDRYSQVRDIVEEHYANEEVEINTQDMLESLKDVWKCRECPDGYLEIIIYSKMGNPYYFRQCSNCSHRTKSQLHTPSVRGLIKPPRIK